MMAKTREKATCMAMRGDRLDELELVLGPMTPEYSAFGGTAFTVSIDLRNSTPRDSAPRTRLPAARRPGGALERRGQTEAAVDLTVPAKPTRPASVRPTVSSCF